MGIIHSPPDESFVSFPRLPAYPSILSYLLLPLTTFAPLPSSYICIKSSIFDVLRKGYGPTADTSRSSHGKRFVSFLKVSCSFGKQIHSLNVILAICRGKKKKCRIDERSSAAVSRNGRIADRFQVFCDDDAFTPSLRNNR